jgi:ABC-type transport system involved in multi-copper enzyme maturation permease subunit
MIKCLRDIWTVARHELLDSVRGKRFAVVLLIYIAGAMLACNACISVLHRLENQIAETLMLSASSSPGAVTDALMKSKSFQRMVIELVKDREVAMELLSVPPLALIYAGLAFTFTPILIMLSAPSRIAHEISSGSARFALVRTSRGAWCTGKFLGQALEIILPLMLSAVGAWAIARIRVPDMADASVVLALITYGWKIWIYCLAFIGLALGVSQVCRSVNQATAFGLIIWTGLTVLYHAANHYAGEGLREAWNIIPVLLPAGHRLDLWRSDPARVVPAIVYLVTLAMVYFSIGHMFFRKKNL